MTTDEMRALAEQCISHPASRTTGDIIRAGMAIIELLERVDSDRLSCIAHGMRGPFDLEPKVTEDQQKALQELADDAQLVYSAWSR